MSFKHQQMLKLCVFTDEDIMTMNMDEQMKIVDKAIKDRRFYLEMINPARKKDDGSESSKL